ncbi:hypothetical protein [Kitasatospora sp. NPDC050463]|uniref:hypothetical protein n=1 Tax=Kitasatospora sp. NPDC050463 TaxID=3155786 RepID=UPI00340C8BC8
MGRAPSTSESRNDLAGRARPRTATGGLRPHGGHTEGAGPLIAEAQRAVEPAGDAGQGAVQLFLRARPCRAKGDDERAPSYVDEPRVTDLLTLHDRWRAPLLRSRRLPALDTRARGRATLWSAAEGAGHPDLVADA